MKYWRSAEFIFSNEKWWLNLLIASVCFIVPIVGPLVFMGYLALMIEEFHRTRDDSSYEIFDIDKLSEYIKRGVWPFIAAFILGLLVVPFVMLSNLIGMAGCLFLEHNHIQWLIPVFMILVISASFIISISISFLSLPVSVGCALGGNLKAGFSWSFLWPFIKNCWLQILLAFLFIYFFTIAAGIVGIIFSFVTCGIGFLLFYPLGGLVMMMQWHLFWQIYELDLERGGNPVELKRD